MKEVELNLDALVVVVAEVVVNATTPNNALSGGQSRTRDVTRNGKDLEMNSFRSLSPVFDKQ